MGFLNRNYNELEHYSGFGETKTEGEDGEVFQPNAIPEAVKVLTVFVKARKIKNYALELGDFITENIFTLSFEDPGFTFKAIYKKLIGKFRPRGVRSKALQSSRQRSFPRWSETRSTSSTRDLRKSNLKGTTILVLVIFVTQKGQSRTSIGYIQLQCGTVPSVAETKTIPRSTAH